MVKPKSLADIMKEVVSQHKNRTQNLKDISKKNTSKKTEAQIKP